MSQGAVSLQQPDLADPLQQFVTVLHFHMA